MEIYSAFNIKVNNTNREAGRFPYFFCALGEPFEKLIHIGTVMNKMLNNTISILLLPGGGELRYIYLILELSFNSYPEKKRIVFV